MDPAEATKSETGSAFFNAVAGDAGGDKPLDKTGKRASGENVAKEDVKQKPDTSDGAAGQEPVAGTNPAGSSTEARSEGLSVANIVVSSDGGQVRTLEDTVSELLRPLLREWLENNMPRIVENALRLEMAESVKKQLDLTATKPSGIDK